MLRMPGCSRRESIVKYPGQRVDRRPDDSFMTRSPGFCRRLSIARARLSDRRTGRTRASVLLKRREILHTRDLFSCIHYIPGARGYNAVVSANKASIARFC